MSYILLVYMGFQTQNRTGPRFGVAKTRYAKKNQGAAASRVEQPWKCPLPEPWAPAQPMPPGCVCGWEPHEV